MKIRTILAFAAAPAALAVALLGTGTAAHAAVAPTTRTLVTNEHHVTDTTSVPTGKMDPSGGGPIWAYDDLSRIVTVTPDAQAPGSYDVSISTVGYAHPFANPITGKAWHPKNHNVYMLGSIRVCRDAAGRRAPGEPPAGVDERQLPLGRRAQRGVRPAEGQLRTGPPGRRRALQLHLLRRARRAERRAVQPGRLTRPGAWRI